MASLISVGQVIDHSFEHYQKHFKELASIALWSIPAAAPWVVGRILVSPSLVTLTTSPNFGPTEIVGFVLMGLGGLVMLVTGFWIGIAIVLSIREQVAGRRGDVQAVGQQAWKLFWPFLWVAILTTLIYVGFMLLSAPGIALAILGQTVNGFPSGLAAFGAPLIIIGLGASFFFILKRSIEYAFVRFAVAYEDKRGMMALRTSQGLVTGRWWATFVRLFVPGLVFSLLIFAVQVVVSVGGSLLFAIFAASESAFLLNLGDIVTTLLSTGFNSLVIPLLILAAYHVYDSLRTVKV